MTTSKYPLRPLGEVLRLDRQEVAVDPTQVYRTAGINNRGRGLFERAPIMGAETSYATYYRLSEGQVVFSRLFAFEGSVAVVGAEHDGLFVSNEFPTFSVKAGEAEISYLEGLIRWPTFHDLLAGAATGMGQRRQRVHPDAFLEIEVPMPEIEVQRQVACGIDSALRHHAQLSEGARRSLEEHDRVLDRSIDELIARCFAVGWRSAALCEVADINPRPVAVADDQLVTFVPMSEVDGLTGAIRASAPVVTIADLQSHYRQFRSGDVLFARITPCMQNGKTAIAHLKTEVGYGSTEFHIIRPNGRISNRWIHRMLRAERFRVEAATRFTGTAGQQRVPAGFMREAVIPIPPTEADETRVLAQIDSFEVTRVELHRLGSARRQLIEAIRPAVLNRAFAGLV